LLRDIEQGVLVLEANPEDPDTLATVFRAFHTFKGNAAVMKLAELHRLAHEVESLLDAARRGGRSLDREAIDVILAAADCFARFVDEMARQIEGIGIGRSLSLPVPAIIEAVTTILAAAPAPQAARGHAPEPLPSPRTTVAVEPAAAAPPPAPARPPVPETTQPAAPAHPAPAVPAAPLPTAVASIRVDTHKLDGLIDLVGELVTLAAAVKEGMEANSREKADSPIHQFGHLAGDLEGLAKEAKLPADVEAAVVKAGEDLFNAFDKLDEAVHGAGDIADAWREHADGIAAGLKTLQDAVAK